MFPRVALMATMLSALLQSGALTLAASTPQPVASPAISKAAAAHVLNRLAYGPRPGDIERLERTGIQGWTEQQLHPERIDDRALDARLAAFQTLGLDTGTILREYHQPAMRERRERLRQSTVRANPAGTGTDTEVPDGAATPAITPERVRRAMTEAQRKDRLVLAELSEARLLRAIFSERQLQEVLTDFWFNHFNVFAGKGPTRAYLTAFERDAIRPYVLGSFREMLEAVASSPAMLFYLDNWQNVRPQALDRAQQARRRARPGPDAFLQPARGQSAGQGQRAARGINENFARELLELHTLGVEGGYTQDDIVNVARAFTGWTMRPMQGTGFLFVPALHDTSEKNVLGRTIGAGGGIEDGRQVLDLLVAHPATARFIATKLARKFVSDTPPAALIDRAARRFRETRGDLRQVTRVIITSPEFLSADAHRAKIKTPMEFVASALRSTGAEIRTALPLVRMLRDLGMPVYFCQPPTGYDETADTWVSSGALVSRLNFALDLANGRLRGVSLPSRSEAIDAVRDRLISEALAGEVSDTTRAMVMQATGRDQVVALVIGSPEFQRQ